VEISGYPLGVDRAEVVGRVLSDKAPGQPFLAVPIYALGQALGFQPAYELNIQSNLTLWLVTFGTATLPAVLLYHVGRRIASYGGGLSGELAAAAIATGTILLPFSTLLFGHVMAGLAVGAAYLVLRGARGHLGFALAGLLAGLGVLIEYQTVLAAVVLGAWALRRGRLRGGAAFLLGGLIPATLLGVYNAAAFGSVLGFSYQFSAFPEAVERAAPAPEIFGWRPIDNLLLVFFSLRGFAVASPVVLLALLGVVVAIRSKDRREEAIVQLGVFLALLAVPVLWSNPWGGESPGPRYLAPALVVLTSGLANVWRIRPIAAFVAWSISFASMLAATATDPLSLPRSSGRGVDVWLAEAVRGNFMRTVPEVIWGFPGRVVSLVLLGSLALLLGWAMYRTSKALASRERVPGSFRLTATKTSRVVGADALKQDRG